MPVLPPDSTKERVFTQERDKVIAEKVRKLLEVDFIKEIYYSEWLANVVVDTPFCNLHLTSNGG